MNTPGSGLYVAIVSDDDSFIETARRFFTPLTGSIVVVRETGTITPTQNEDARIILYDAMSDVFNQDMMRKNNTNKSFFRIVAINETNHMTLYSATNIQADRYIKNPLELDILRDIVDNYLDGIRFARESRRNKKLYEEYKRALDSFAIFSISDPQGHIRYVNDEFCRVTGYERDEIIGQRYSMLRHPDMSAVVFANLWQTVTKGETWKGILENKRKDESSFFIDATIVPIQDASCTIVEFLAISYEITALKIARDRYLDTVLDADSSPVLVSDYNFTIQSANTAFLQTFGLSDIKQFYANGGSLCQYIIDRDGYLKPALVEAIDYRERLYRLMSIIHSAGISGQKILINTPAKGERCFTIKHSSVTDKFFLGRCYHIFNFVDITELEHLREQQINTIKLTSIGKLAAGVTHEINTPLTYVKGNLEMLKMQLKEDTLDTKEALDCCTDMQDGISRIAMIVESMREIAGSSRNAKAPTNLYTTLVYAMRMIYNRAKQICTLWLNETLFDLTMDKNHEIYMFNASAQRLEQVWIILLNNALDEFSHSPLAFETRRIDIDVLESFDTIKVSFKDNAGGIDTSMLEHLFEMFSSSKPQSGMGIGLSVAKSIIEDHGGTITAFNDNDSAVFEIVFHKIPTQGA